MFNTLVKEPTLNTSKKLLFAIGYGVRTGRRSAHAHVLRILNDNMAVSVPDVGHGANYSVNLISEWLSGVSCNPLPCSLA